MTCAGSLADLSDPATLDALGVEASALRGPWQRIAFIEKRSPPTWSLCEKLLAQGVDGARVPSVQAAGTNLVLWRWNVEDAAQVVALDPLRDLPADQSSWKR